MSSIDNRSLTYRELDTAFEKINKEIKKGIRETPSEKIVSGLIRDGFKDVKANRNGGIYAVHENHTKHKDDSLFFGNLNSDQLENECAESVFNMGKRIILREEGKEYTKGKSYRELDAIIDGRLMDIASITQHGAHTIRNILLNKNKQLRDFNFQHGQNADTVCIYFHEPSWYNEAEVRRQYNDFKQCSQVETNYIKNIYIVLYGANEIIKIHV